MPFTNSKILVALYVAIASTDVAAQVDFCTSTPATTSLPLNVTGTNAVRGLRLGWDGDSCPDGGGMLAPKNIHWHIYTLSPDEEEDEGGARIAMSPGSLVRHDVLSDGTLQFRPRELDFFYSCDDPIQAGVALWLPASYMTNIEIVGVGWTDVDINYSGTEPLTVENCGISNSMSITSLQAPVKYSGSGIETAAKIVATGAVGSSVELSGVNSRVAIAVPPEDDDTNNTTMTDIDDLLQVSLSGVDVKATIDGAYGRILFEGVNTGAITNTNCDRITDDGIGTRCDATMNFTITIAEDELSCLADTVVAKVHKCLGWENWQGALIGASVGVVLAVLLCIGGCVACCCLCGRGRRRREAKLASDSPMEKQQPLGEKEMPVFMGRVVDPEAQTPVAATASTIPIDPHLITAKTGTEPSKADVTGAYL